MDTKQFIAYMPQVLRLIALASQVVPQTAAVSKYLTILAAIAEQGVKAYDDLAALKELVEAMVAQKRDPHDEEWLALKLRSDAAHAAIQDYNFDSEG